MTNLSISTKVRRDKNPINHLQRFLIWAALKGMFITNLGTCNDGTSMDSWTEYKVLHSPCCSQNHYSIFTKHLWDVWDCFLALKCFLNFVDKKTKLKKGKSFTVTSKSTGGVNITKKYLFLLPHSTAQGSVP